MINAGGAPDRLLRGEAGRRGWGDQSAPDPVLLVPTSFDPEARRFGYQVNPRFGRPGGSSGAWHSPLQLRVRMSIPLGATLEEQQDRTVARAARATQGDPAVIERGLWVRDPFADLRPFRDTLQLTVGQEEAVKAAEARWRQAVDSASARLVAFLQQVSDTVPEAEVAAGVKRTREEIGEATRDVGRALGEILTPDQLGRLPRRLVAWVTGRFEGGIAPF